MLVYVINKEGKGAYRREFLGEIKNYMIMF